MCIRSIDEHKYKFDLQTGKECSLIDDNCYLGHLENVFLEDYWHDWRVSNHHFFFYGHSGKNGDSHDLLVIFEY